VVRLATNEKPTAKEI